jgi:superfamily II DNA or RNA helicase
VNWPWIEHLILAFVAGSLQTYLQIGGRGLRASPETGKTQVIIQDHGG